MARTTHRMHADRRPTRKITGVIATWLLTSALTALAPAWFGVEISPEVAVTIAGALISATGYQLHDRTHRPE